MKPIAIFGITGRMGQSLLRALREEPASFVLSGAVAAADCGRLGQDAGDGVLITADSGVGIRGAAVALDFSSSTAVFWAWANWTGRLPEPALSGVDPDDIEVHDDPTV